MEKYYSIAVDGPSGAGKSTLSRRCAKAFGFIYVDTGAIYRTIGLAAYRRGLNKENEAELMEMLPQLDIKMAYEDKGEQKMYLDGEDVSAQIRLPEISTAASQVSAHAKVREYLLEMQRKMARENNVIMDGRDIGTVVLPGAELKIFLTASSEARAKRRFLELQQKGIDTDFQQVLADIEKRDKNDSERAAAPLKAAEDSILVDTSQLDFEQSFNKLCEIISEKLNIKKTEDR